MVSVAPTVTSGGQTIYFETSTVMAKLTTGDDVVGRTFLSVICSPIGATHLSHSGPATMDVQRIVV